MKPASCKNKGRKFQQAIAALIRAYFDLPEPDAISTSMGKSGIDIQLSSAARERFNYAVECKNTERINIWEALEQAEQNAKKENLIPLVAFTRNRTKAYVALPLETFMELASGRKL